MTSTPTRDDFVYLRAGGTSVVFDLRHDDGTPVMLHWGEDLGDLPGDDLAAIALAASPQRLAGGVDEPSLVTLIPTAASGWTGTPGIEGHRCGHAFSTAFVVSVVRIEVTPSGSHRATFECADPAAQLTLTIEVEVTGSGLLRERLTVVNAADDTFELQRLQATFAVPNSATEVLDTTGRWIRERSPQRHNLTVGTYVRESRKGRPGADATVLLALGEPGFGFRHGAVWAVHVAWSGNHRVAVEKHSFGESVLSGGELLLPGEMLLAPGAAYRSPWIYGSWGIGLDAVAARFHAHLRALPSHRSERRPVTLNTWEAVYFDHDLDKLTSIADAGAAIGVERYVLDDGWFAGRRSDDAGLGDWYVDSTVWPDGLTPLIKHVRGLGMEFGLWVEPEMANLDSELVRQHPDWVLKPAGRMPPESRQQQVLNLAIPEAFDHILGRLDALLSDHDISYLKWDHNRDLLEPGDARTGLAAVHEHTLAVYRLIDEIRLRHPGVEIENCASGAARLDLAMLERTDRIWASDCIDPLERIQIQQYSGLLAPLEMMGAHVGAPRSHTTGRVLGLDFMAGTALLGHFGIESDLTQTTPEERTHLGGWIAAYKELRELLHSGVVVNADHPDPAVRIRGVVSADRREAIFTFTQVTTSVTPSAGRFTLPGLDPDARYAVSLREPGNVVHGPGLSPLAWSAGPPLRISGRALGVLGLRAPVLDPEQLIVISAIAQDD